MRKVLSLINVIFSMICGWLMVVLMLMLVLDFSTRGLPDGLRWLAANLHLSFLADLASSEWLQPITILPDLSVFIMIIGIYLGLALCEERYMHVSIEFATIHLKGTPKRCVEFVSFLLQAAALGVMVWAMFRNTLKSYNTSEAVPGVVPMEIWPVKVFVCVGLVLYMLQVLLHLWDKTRNLIRPQQAG